MIGNHITVLNTVDSSNNYAMQQVHAGMAQHGQVWFAMEQTAGKGQRGKVWTGTPAQNILMSVVLETSNLTIDQQFRLSAAIAVAVRNFFASHAGMETSIKWPNDLYWCDKKAGGILVENVIGRTVATRPFTSTSILNNGPTSSLALNQQVFKLATPTTTISDNTSTENTWKWAVVGIGININQVFFPDYLPNAISLHHITGQHYEVLDLVPALCGCIETQWQLLQNGHWDLIFEQYNQHLYKRGQAVRLRRNNVVIPCTIRGVGQQGKLLIDEDPNVQFDFGEVNWEL